jgi:TPR repeat protein
MDNDTITKIINLGPTELYEQSIKFKEDKDYSNYFVYLFMSANKDYDLAITAVSDEYYNDKLYLKQNFSQTIPFYQATKDYSYTAHFLGYIYECGHSVVKNEARAKELYKVSIEKGNMHAIHNKAANYKNKKKKTKELYELAASKGSYRSMNNLASLYAKGSKGVGIDKDYNKARELYEKAFILDKDVALKGLVALYKETDLKDDVDYVFNYFNGIDKLGELGKIYNYNSTNTKEQNIKLKDLYEKIISVSKGKEVLHSLAILYKNTDLKDDTEYVFNYFTSNDGISKLQTIYGFDTFTMDLFKDNIKIQNHIESTKKLISSQ